MPGEMNKELSDLINDALSEVTPNAPVSDPPETSTDDGAGDEPLDGAEGAVDDGALDDEGEEGAASDEASDEDDAQGEGAGGEAEGEPAADDAETVAAAEAARVAAEAGKSDADKQREKEQKALNDPIPKDVAPPTQQRMRDLVKIGKEAVVARDAAIAQVNDIAGAMQSCGITPPQYKEWLGFMSKFNSPDAAQQGEALTLLEDMVDRLAGLLGKERRASDPIAEFADLQAAITAGQVTRKIATEMALQRRQAKFRQQSQDFTRTEQQTAEQRQAEVTAATQSLNELGKNLEARDKQYGAKLKILIPQFKTLRDRIPPTQWRQTFLDLYRETKVGSAGAALAASRKGAPPKQPLRSKSSTSSGQGKPANAAEGALGAMSAALAGMKSK